MACGCRFNNSNLQNASFPTAQPMVASTVSSPFVPVVNMDVATTTQATTLVPRPVCGGVRQCFAPSNVFCARQVAVLSGQLIGITPLADVPIFTSVNGMPGVVFTDETGRYTLDVDPCENVVITAPVVAGFTPSPMEYRFTPVCFSRPDLDFRYTPSTGVLTLSLATQTLPPYSLPPNAWPRGGVAGPNLAMVERIVPSFAITPTLVKFAPGVQDAAFFQTGGTDVTATWQNGIPVTANGRYTVYARLPGGSEVISVIDVETLRDGTALRPYLLLDFDTALSQQALIPGSGDFTLYYMQGGGAKLTQFYELFEDIDMAGRAWEPLGEIHPGFPFSFVSGFSGGLDGTGHIIDNLAPSTADGTVKAFLAGLEGGAVIQNLTLDHYSAIGTGSENIMGGFAAALSSENGLPILFSNSTINGTIQSQSIFGTAAFVAYVVGMDGILRMENCHVNATVIGRDQVGGFVGNMRGFVTGALRFADCTTTGSVSGLQQVGGYVGGWIGDGLENDILRCVNGMNVTATSLYGGGFVGTAYCSRDSAVFMVTESLNTGNVTGGAQVGGFFGQMGGNETLLSFGYIIRDCYNTGNITGTAAPFSVSGGGGIVGVTEVKALVENSYATGTVTFTGTSSSGVYTAGLVGAYDHVQNSAAINQRVSSSTLPTARVAAGVRSAVVPAPLLANNLAWQGMQVLVNGVPKSPLQEGGNQPDGEPRSAASLTTQTTYQNDLGWNFASVWQFGNGAYNLPVLLGIPLNLQPMAALGYLV